MFKRKKILITSIFIFSFVCAAYISQAGITETGSGWLWGGSDANLGWISMNNVTAGGAVSYGVNIPATDGPLSGYAWSENLGWINFSGASRSGNNINGSATIQGIADASAAGNSGGWQGRISLSGMAQDASTYGVAIDPATNNLTGFAWSDELGWIDFSRASASILIPGACGTANNLNHIYAATDTDWGAYTACDSGSTASVILDSSNFPPAGGNFGWTCSNETTVNCTGSRMETCIATNCEAMTCIGSTCSDCRGTIDGTKNCQRNLNWREVSPN